VGGGGGWSGRVLIIAAGQQIVHVRDEILIVRLKINSGTGTTGIVIKNSRTLIPVYFRTIYIFVNKNLNDEDVLTIKS
jgi:hypothetical protein